MFLEWDARMGPAPNHLVHVLKLKKNYKLKYNSCMIVYVIGSELVQNQSLYDNLSSLGEIT